MAKPVIGPSSKCHRMGTHIGHTWLFKMLQNGLFRYILWHMSKPVTTFVLNVLRKVLLRYKLDEMSEPVVRFVFKTVGMLRSVTMMMMMMTMMMMMMTMTLTITMMIIQSLVTWVFRGTWVFGFWLSPWCPFGHILH